MGGATNCPETPRQKMIGMMYIVLTALLALNVSVSILDGFTMVEQSLKVNIQGSERRNTNLYEKFKSLADQNPTKIGEWLKKATEIQKESDALSKQIEDLKVQIVKQADGDDGDVNHIEGRDNLDAASHVCLGDGGLGKGIDLKKAIDKYKQTLLKYVSDPAKQELINKTFYTGSLKGHDGESKPWEVANFQMMPVAAAVTLLTKMQADIRNIEGEAVTYLRSQVDADDFRVNKIEAKVIPTSKYVIQGSSYEAQIILAAIDTLAKPEIFIGGKDGNGGTKLESTDGIYKRAASSIGDQKYAGYIKIKNPAGEARYYNFESDFTVGAPSATISADKMNVFYAGVDNPVSISVPGIPSTAVTATITNGSIVRSGAGWIVRPAKIGQEAVVTVSAKIENKVQVMGKGIFRVKMLPNPIAVINYPDANGNIVEYKGGAPGLQKTLLLSANRISAVLDNSEFDAKFQVLKFELNITNAMGSMIEMSSGPNFTQKQMDYLKQQPKGKKVFLSGIVAKGPDGTDRKLSPVEIIIN